ncbi:hypothetical protein [Modestobacter marinus]|uniref:hypothetical protein n=1 Tax=Modestobacter marinus TaxID=477641 RepID=UPI001C974AFD|nr:hypothetical protein [Modestobacter marinus]
MSSGVRRAGVVLTVLLAVLGLLAGPAAAADDRAAAWQADRVLVVGVAGLTWADLDPERTPELWTLAEGSAVAALSVRAARSTTCLLDGWASLGAGNRARYPGPDEPVPPVPLPSAPLPEEDDGTTDAPADPSTPATGGAGEAEGAEETAELVPTGCAFQEQVARVGLDDPRRTTARIAEDPGTARFGAEPGALGEAVPCSTAVGRPASLAVAGEQAQFAVTDTLPADAGTTSALLSDCPLTLVALDQLAGTGPATADAEADAARRVAAVAEVDQSVGLLRAAVAAVPGETLLLLAGTSEVGDGDPQLHVGLASAPGLPAGWLTSSSTGRAPFAQLIDLAPTVLGALQLDVPASMNGQPLSVAGSRPDLATSLAELADVNTRAVAHHRSTGTFYWVLVALNAALVGVALLTLGGWDRGPLPPRLRAWLRGRHAVPGAVPAVRVAALAVAALPVSTYLANLLPWERAGTPRLAMAAAVLLADVVVTAVAVGGPWRHGRLGPPGAVLAVTLTTLAADVLTGSNLELDGLLGYDAVVAGRFTGYGNLSLGLLSVSALLLTAALAARVAGTGPGRRRWLLPVLLSGAVCVVLVGAPSLGRDFGGVLAVVPGFLVLGMLLARMRVTVVRLVAVLGAAVVVVGSVAVLDWLRPAAQRTHLGRFVGQVIDGQAWTVVGRKAEANISILVGSALSWMLLVALVAAVWLLRPGGLLRSGADRPAAGLPPSRVRVLRAGLTAAALSLTLGALVNDSGVAVPATAAALLVPLLVNLVATGDAAGGAPGPGRAAADPGVNVGLRGSTGRTT